MNTPARLAIFAAGLLIAFAAAWGIGAAVGPTPTEHTNQDRGVTTPGGATHDH